MKFSECAGESRTFKGLGDATTLGERVCYICFEGGTVSKKPQGVLLDGAVNSHELSQGDNLMLLSFAAQGTMGLGKDVEAGTCYSKEEGI